MCVTVIYNLSASEVKRGLVCADGKKGWGEGGGGGVKWYRCVQRKEECNSFDATGGIVYSLVKGMFP